MPKKYVNPHQMSWREVAHMSLIVAGGSLAAGFGCGLISWLGTSVCEWSFTVEQFRKIVGGITTIAFMAGFVLSCVFAILRGILK